MCVHIRDSYVSRWLWIVSAIWQDEDRDEQQEMEHKLQPVVNGPSDMAKS